MTYPLYNFTGTQAGSDQQAQNNLSQYIQQGQIQLNPGQAQVAASSPVSSAGQMNLAQALYYANQANNTPDAQFKAGQDAMANGAILQPNVNGENMGGVGPTVNNAAAMASYMPAQQPTMGQQLGNYLSGLFGSGS